MAPQEFAMFMFGDHCSALRTRVLIAVIQNLTKA